MRGTARENRVRLVVGSVLVALAAAVALTSAAAAGADAAKQRVVITMKALPDGQFVLEPLQAGALKGDMGTTSIVWGDPRNVIRDRSLSSRMRHSVVVFSEQPPVWSAC